MDYSEADELDEINHRNTKEYIPAIVFVSVVIITGITVNIFATIFYAFKAPKSVIQIFMFSLSLNDLVTNFVLLHDLVELFYFIQYKSVVACKLFYVLKHCFVGDSLLFMVAIAWDRYRRVCFPFSKEITLRVAWFIILGLMLFSVCLSVRSFATADILRINITTEHNTTIQGYYCTLSEEQKLAVVRSIFHIVDICIHGIIICLLVFFYSFVVRKLIQSQKKLKSHDNLRIVAYKRKASHAQNVHIHTEGSSTDIVEISLSKSEHDHNPSTNKTTTECESANKDNAHIGKQDIENKEPYMRTRERLGHSIHIAIGKLPFSHSRDTDSDTEVSTDIDSKEHKTKTKHLSTIFNRNRYKSKKPRNATSRMEKRMTVMVAVITVASIACFVPYYVSMMVISPNLNGNGLVLNVGSIILRRSFLLNSAINPFIMVVFNAAFKHFLLDIFHRISSRCRIGNFKMFK